ncbi:FecCD family ABC transporter permease [Gottfriedia solisilvae]|uniref:Siderophore ABC transporter permease n=1 Tax=Gottfriedia solisilvae TaxID=1516104 RepID=A0A8J3F010_9BACI|nr:iron ABC transporter permease [Gottfriedia solisilvae]GGI15499.1 siderophore ABC transporter permease [Gottfriedia solisilvae]
MLIHFRSRMIVLIACILLFVVCFFSSILLGYTDTSFTNLIHTFTNFNGSNEHLIIQNVRIPRAIIASVVGASLAIAGLFMQVLTKNPLASPSVLGINAGASMLIVLSITFFNLQSVTATIWLSFIGAALSSLFVFGLSSLGKDGATPLKITLAGVSIAAMFSSITQGLLVTNEVALDQVLFWLAGSVQGRSLDSLVLVLPYIVVAWVISLALGSKINTFMLGEDLSKALGQNTAMLKITLVVLVIVLAGGAVSVAGPIGLVGIIVPQIVRMFVKNDYRWMIPFTGVVGAILLLLADIASRYLLMPEETPVGITTAVIGAPFFIYLARKGGTIK